MTIVIFFFRRAITLKEFLDIIEIAFITEVNMRRSVVPSAVVSLVTMLCKIIWLFNSESFFNDSGNNWILNNTLTFCGHLPPPLPLSMLICKMV